MKLHCIPSSPNSIKVRAALELLAIPCELRVVNPLQGDHKTPEFLAKNPHGRIPVLEDGDFVLWESNAILQYLGSQKPESGFWPAEPRAQAQVSAWMCWQLAHWGAAINVLLYENLARRSLGKGNPDPQAVAKGEEDFHRCATALDGHLKGRAHVALDHLTAADVALAPGLLYADLARVPWRHYDEIVRWYAELSATPWWKKAQPQ